MFHFLFIYNCCFGKRDMVRLKKTENRRENRTRDSAFYVKKCKNKLCEKKIVLF